MKVSRWAGLVAIAVCTSVSVYAQQAQQQGRGGGRGGGRGQMTAEEREARAKAAHEEEAAKPRPIAALDSVWIEELTYMEVRDAIKGGKTTALIIAGSTEQNGPYLPGGKHRYAIELVGESIARKLGNALVAPIVVMEQGNPENPYLEWGSIYFSADTYRGVIRDMATSLKSQGFTNIVLMGDSGGNTAGLRDVAAELAPKWGTEAKIVHVPEYYNWTSRGGVRDFIRENGIEETQQDGIHDEYGLSAVLMAADPQHVRYDQREKAKLLTINGVDISDKAKTMEMGRKIVEFRANVAVEAIKKALGAA